MLGVFWDYVLAQAGLMMGEALVFPSEAKL